MLNRGKKGLALLLSTVFAVAAVAGAFPVVTFAQDEPTQAVVVQQEGEALLAPLDSLFRQHPAYRIRHPRVDALCRNGNPFTVRQPLPEGLYRVYGLEGEFLCLSRLEGGVMTSLKNFFGA